VVSFQWENTHSHPLNDFKAQEDLKKLQNSVNRIFIVNNLDKDKVIIMTQDEGRFGRVNIPKASWAPLGIRPVVGKQVVRQSFYVYCAVAPSLGIISSLILPFANTDMMNLFLDNVSKEFRNNEVIMQIDGAGWHRSKSLIIPKIYS